MSAHAEVHLDPHEQRELPHTRFAPAMLVAGMAVLVGAYLLSRGMEGGSRRFWLAYVHSFSFVLSLSLGGLFFVIIQHLTKAGWSVVVRRPAEIIAANGLVLAATFVPIAVVVAGGSGVLYPWAQPVPAESAETHDAAESHDDASDAAHTAQAAGHGLDELTLGKRAYLNPGFFIVRWIVYFAVWGGLGVYYLRQSSRQDASGDTKLTLAMQKLSAPAIVLFGATITLAAFDLLMSLDPHWFSTIFGVYYFSGAVVGFFALMILLFALLQRKGLLTRSVNVEHYHDLGKLLFAFVFFWGYIAFSQYMLIWYGSIPEETGWYFRRGCATQEPNAWSAVIVLILLGHFVVPFVGLLSRHVKRRLAALCFWAVWMLLFHWIDLYWLVMPELRLNHLPLGPVEFGCLIGLTAIFVAGLAWLARGRKLLAVGDPRLGESLAFRNT